MTTTCIIDVANSCSSYPNDLIYQMEALRDKNSKILFRSRMTRQEERIADFEEICGDMLLNMCGGMPLGIIIAADLLARKSEDLRELKMLWEFIHSSLKQYSTSDGMTKILHMSYADLPLPLRSCFLYMGVFVGNYTIRKDHLIWLWGAEGFIPKRDEECLWVTGERYFGELISRRLIQPVFTNDDDQAVGCTVHTVILDFVRSISREENFAIRATELNSSPFPCDTIRRYSLDCCNQDEVGTLSTSSVHLSSMRSLTVFGKLDPPVPPADDERTSKHGEEMHATKALAVTSWYTELATKQMLKKKALAVYRDDEMISDDERISDHQGSPSVSKHGEEEEMHATAAPEEEESMQSLTNFEEQLDPPNSPADDKEMHATKAPEVSMFNLSAFKLVRVLHLEDTKNLKKHHLEGIGGLVLLRYLGLAGTGITQLPEEMGELEQLETLDLTRNIWLTTFPASIVKLQKVRHLLLPGYAEQIWEMPELEVASGIRVETGSSSSLGGVAQLLSKSKQLRMLSLFLKAEPTKADLKLFLEEVVKSKLQSISIGFGCYRLYDVIPLLLKSWESVTAPPAEEFEPQRFELRITSSGLMRVPGNMGSLASLTHLHIILGQAIAEDFLVLGGLTNLVLLSLVAEEYLGREKRFIIKGGIFPCLKVFSFRIRNSWMGLEIEEGAMPQLRRLGRGFRVSERRNRAYLDIGIEHLTCLTRVHATFNCQDATISEVEAAEAAIRAQVSLIATKPTMELSRV